MNLDQIKYVHFIGIGGIGMSALARYFNQIGKNVSGYDKTETELTKSLQKEGINVYFKNDVDFIPDVIKLVSEDDRLVVYTPAIPKEQVEIQYFLNRKIPLYKRAEVLGMMSEQLPTIAIAGTHGKTSTTALLAYIMLKSKIDFVGFIGGITENIGSNMVVKGNPKFMLTEADEYDRSFLKLKPKYALITSTDADHLDIYEDELSMQDGFISFAQLVDDPQGLVLEEKIFNKIPSEKKMSYGLSTWAHAHADKIQLKDGTFSFDYIGKDHVINNIQLNLPGNHNLENCIGAITLALKIGISTSEIKNALYFYKGVKRRFEYHIKREDFIYIDDYAHHPTEIDAVISALRVMYPSKKITGVFQPHLYSRTKDFADAFARSLEKLDQVILLDIYPAREQPIEGITSEWLLQKINCESKSLYGKNNLIPALKGMDMDVLLTIGAGDIDQLVKPITKTFKL